MKLYLLFLSQIHIRDFKRQSVSTRCCMKNEESIDRIIQVNDIRIGSNIAKRRKALKIKQIDMVAKLQISGIDISIYSYNRIEKGTQNPTVSLLYACCKILDCDMNAIFNFPAS